MNSCRRSVAGNPHPRSSTGAPVIAFLVLLAAEPLGAAWREVAAGVRYQRFVSRSTDIHVARIDLRQVDVLVTPAEDRGVTVTDFARRSAAVVAVNGDYFSAAREPVGLTVSRCGAWPGTADDRRSAVIAFGRERAVIYAESDLTAVEPWMVAAVSGFPLLVEGCRARRSTELRGRPAFTRSPHPRTAAGLSRDGLTLDLVVADGRRGDIAGLTLPQLASWMRRKLKVCSAVNLDGGGSSAMWIDGRIVNRPSDGLERPVANHLAIVPSGSATVRCDQDGPK